MYHTALNSQAETNPRRNLSLSKKKNPRRNFSFSFYAARQTRTKKGQQPTSPAAMHHQAQQNSGREPPPRLHMPWSRGARTRAKPPPKLRGRRQKSCPDSAQERRNPPRRRPKPAKLVREGPGPTRRRRGSMIGVRCAPNRI